MSSWERDAAEIEAAELFATEQEDRGEHEMLVEEYERESARDYESESF